MQTNQSLICGVVLASLFASGVTIADTNGKKDFGQIYQDRLAAQSEMLFGFEKPVAASATADDVIARNNATADERQLLAKGLKAEFITRKVGGLGDMIVFWPDDINYTHLIVCNEWGRTGETPAGNSGYNPSVQRIDVDSGEVTTILYGMSRCDGIRATQWGTVLATEESGTSGSAYEIIDPLNTDGHWVADRGEAGTPAEIRNAVDGTEESENIVKRVALAAQSWEGLEVLDSGVVIGGDELRTDEDNDGGAIFRFVPKHPYQCQGSPVRPGQLCDNTISKLEDSPLVQGQNYALFTVCSGTDDYGQGCEYGTGGRWVEVNAATARFDAQANGATGFCRPEDLHVDRSYGLYNSGEGIKWCWNNTCGGGKGETLCAVEDNASVIASNSKLINIGGSAGEKSFLAKADNSLASVDVSRFVENDAEMRSHDNLDIQPVTSNVYIIEDFKFGDVWSCLPDGTDRDNKSDGCVRVLSVRDPNAEPSGFIFDGTGKAAFYHLQHGQNGEGFETLLDFDSNPVNGFTDDLIKITGFKIEK